MSRNITTRSLAFLLLLCVAPVPAQTVYETRGPNGPVFSDKPQAGAKAIELRPLNVIDNAILTGAEKGAAPPAQRKAGSERPGNESASRDQDAAPAYRAFAIVFPENDGSILANTAVFEVRVALEPALRLGEGHAFVVSINGRPVGQRFTATEFMIPPEFWGDQLPPPNQRLQLGAAIVDRNGAVLKEAAPIQFQLRYATVLQRPHPLGPQPRPEPPAKPEAKPVAGVKLPNSAGTPEAQAKPATR